MGFNSAFKGLIFEGQNINNQYQVQNNYYTLKYTEEFTRIYNRRKMMLKDKVTRIESTLIRISFVIG
jgi:hypothetical protein